MWFRQELPVDPIHSPIPIQNRTNFAWVDDKTTIYCYKGIWLLENPNRNPEDLKSKVSKDRKDTCFYVDRSDEMNEEAADELQRRLHHNRQFNRNLRYTQYGLGIAAGGTVLGLIYQILSDFILFP